MNIRFTTTVTAALTGLALTGGLLAGCSGSDGGGTPGAGGSAGGETPAPVVTVTTVGALTGDLDQAGQDQVSEEVGTVVDGWLDGAYLGDFPRTDFTDAFASFTPGAAERAQQQLDLMTNASLTAEATVEAVSRSVSLDILAVKDKAVGVTASVDLVLAAGEEISGTLDLTPTNGGWQVFGFEITRTPTTGSTPTEEAQ
ncbi:hypothetical protein [Nocardioides sp.]|uniref:hypothetical protein n=1 Tax=Nocardioides sp. TaxID=35761 RepID=UPI0039E27DC1